MQSKGWESKRCRNFGGEGICQHNRERSQCKECGGSSICEHNRRRSKCKEWVGVSICPHNRINKISVQGVRRRGHLMGGGICQHNRSKCKECGESSIF